MNPWSVFQAVSKPVVARFAARSILTLFLLCLVPGLAAVVWRARVRADAGRVHARTAAQARGTAVELQFSQALTAAEVLGALVRQSGGGISNFQAIALELLTSRPGIAYLELQPGGIVSDIVPRAGNERALGFNVLKDAAHGPGAYAAIQRRALTVTGPVTLYHGDRGIVVRVPVFQRGREGREYLWGFVAASMRLPEILSRARVDELWTQGYNYAFFVPASVQQKVVIIAARGAVSFQDAVQQPVRAQNLELRLALRPRGGWVDAPKVALDSLGVLVICGWLCLLAYLLERQRRAFEAPERKQKQKDYDGAKNGMASAQAEVTLTELQERLEGTARMAKETNELAQTKLKEAELSAQELQTRLDTATRVAEEAAQAKQAELEQTRRALAQAQQSASELQARVEATTSAESKTAAAALQQDKATIGDLQARLDAAKRSATEAAEASAARLNQAEKRNRELAGRFLKAEIRVTELSALLQEAQADLKRLQNDSTRNGGARNAAPVGPKPSESKETGRGEGVKLVGIAKRQKDRHDDQIDLFQEHLEASGTPTGPGANPRATASTVESRPPVPKLALTSAASAPQKLEEPAGGPVDQVTAQPREGKPTPARRLPAPPRADPAQLRKAVNEILPLLTGQDPGAKDCLKANRATFRAVFTSEAYEEFEQFVKRGEFGTALEQLKKATKKHGMSL